MEPIKFFSYDWSTEETDDEMKINIYGIDEKQKNVLVSVNDFTPYLYIELPVTITWDKNKAMLVKDKLLKVLGRNSTLQKCELKMKKKLYYANFTAHKNPILFPFLLCSFKTIKEVKFLRYNLKDSLYVSGLGKISIKIHEDNANPILQLCCCKNIPTTGWINAYVEKLPQEEMVTTCDYEYKCSYKNLSPEENDVLAKPLIMGFDLEVYSSVKSKMPNIHKSEDKIFQISCVLNREGEENYRKYLLTLGEASPKYVGKDVEIYGYDNESDLLIGFTNFIREHNPNVLTGYNILGFDIPYMIGRAKHCLYIDTEFDRIGFPIFKHAEEKTIKWSSSAYKNQEFQYLDAEGRVIVDLLPIIKRDYKLNNYKLKTVSEHFLEDDTKDPLTAQGIFKCYEIGTRSKNSDGTYSTKAIKAMSIVGKYCVQDTALCNKLMNKLDVWTGLAEMAKVCNVKVFDLYTKGQQVKVFSQVYHFCMYNNIVVEKDGYITKENERYVGAHVFDPIPGVYDKIVPFDFASLYPTTMIAYNIDYSTLVNDSVDNSIKDKDCHVMEWSDHIGCCHDPKVIRKMEIDSLINKEKEKISKLRIKRDSIRGKNSTERKKVFQKQIDELVKGYKPLQEERTELVKSKPKNVMCEKRYYRFLKEPKGVIPTVLQDLLDARKNTRIQIKKNKDIIKNSKESKLINDLSLLNRVLHQRQLSYKVSCNSVESVTPIPCIHNENFVYYTIEELSKGDWVFINEEQEVSTPLDNLYIWSDNGYTKPKYIMRHETNDKLFRVNTHTGLVDCTGDHSLLKPNGDEVKPRELKIKDELMHHQFMLPKDTPEKAMYWTLDNETIFNHELKTKEEEIAFVEGLFFAEGTCGTWGNLIKAKSSWVIYNLDKNLLEKAKIILNKYVGEFEISPFYTSVYHLKPKKIIKALCDEWRPRFYDDRKYKKIPTYIMNSSYDIRHSFLLGYYSGDGNRNLKKGIVITNRGQRGTASLMYLANSLGYKVSVACGKNDDIYRLQLCENFRIKNVNAIKKITETPVISHEGYPIPAPVSFTQEKIVRNKEHITFENGKSSYRNISITCERFPRQKLLDALDIAIENVKKRNAFLISYEKKKLVYKKYCCGREYNISLKVIKGNYPDRNNCDCKKTEPNKNYNKVNLYVKKEEKRYVYDIETENHHFAAGIGHMIVHNSMYGAMGVKRGYLPFMPGAMATTYMGRVNIEKVAEVIPKEFGGKLIYGD